ncbi:GlsB/YeaQ/YmgE family stress response membrane protein [Salmonella enterica]
MNLIIGIVGSYVGAFIGSLFNVQLYGAGYLKNLIFCVIGSVVVLWIW